RAEAVESLLVAEREAQKVPGLQKQLESYKKGKTELELKVREAEAEAAAARAR
ncbi:unnamed protein product, partial [Heterosigma akashiwo]